MHKKPPVPVIVLLVIAILIGGYYGIKTLTSNGNPTLSVSGTIEAGEITISPEMAGKVLEVFVDEGAEIKAGDPLLRMDDSLLQAQRTVAEAGLETSRAASATTGATLELAQNNYNLAFNAARLEAAAGRTADWTAVGSPGYSLPAGYFTQQDLINAAQAEVAATQAVRQTAADILTMKSVESANLDFFAAEARLLAARMAEQGAQDVLTRASLSSNIELRVAAQTAYDITRAEMNSAQAAYDVIKDSEAAQQVISARTDLAIAQERYEAAQDRSLKLQTGEASPKLAVATLNVSQADFANDQAETAIKQAEAQLALIDLQISKLTVRAPSDGVILTRSIEQGEMVSAAAVAFKLGKLYDLSITVYVPEDFYGNLSLGQMATLTVDSFPGESFSARIVNIANQAEFTPRNVQTVEGRKATVFAVKLKLQDLLGRLKPGMPADIIFDK